MRVIDQEAKNYGKPKDRLHIRRMVEGEQTDPGDD
jgi:hypothetical protein